MRAIHRRAWNIAASHFAISCILGIVYLIGVFGSGLSDSYQSEPAWFKGLIAILWMFQSPVALFEWIALKHSARGASVTWLFTVGLLWSLALGYIIAWIAQMRTRRE